MIEPDGTGLVHMGMRDYDPVTARFASRDPLGLGGGDPNLYSYAGSDPVQLSDPLGLASAGVTLCEGVCVGFKWSLTKDGFSACAEGGFGLGNDITINPLGELDDNKGYLKASVEVALGPFVQYELSDEISGDGKCTKNKVNHQLCVFGACVDGGDGLKLAPEKIADLFSKGLKLGVEGKLVGGVCQAITW
ncbi:MAG: RHS repeat-associated core domain-containing protein [Patulibacter sp.]